jgi:cysteine synthase
VLTYSSGNHAQATALACRLLGAQATIVMPQNAPRAKRCATEGYGARIVDYDPAREKREEVAERLRKDGDPVLIPPYDHADVIAGQGTAARELIEEAGRSTCCSSRAAAGDCSRDRRSRRGRSRPPAVSWAWSPSSPTTPRARSAPERSRP